jgi:hypothetical protein
MKLEFRVGPNVRDVDDAGVQAIDDALTRVARSGNELLHMMDPRRINQFPDGPSTWSVAFVPVGDDDVLFITYGNSDRVDRDRVGVNFELSIRVREKESGIWAGMLLRQLVRYMLMSRRELKVGDFMPLPTAITQAVADIPNAPMTMMNAVVLVEDPLLPKIDTPAGAIEVRRVVGIHPDERERMETWSAAGFAQTLAKRDPTLTTDVLRESFANDQMFVADIDEGSRRDGSVFGFVAVDGVTWQRVDDGYRVRFPGGHDGERIRKMIRARLPHGRHLLVHDSDPAKQLAVALEPSNVRNVAVEGDVLVLQLPHDYVRNVAVEGDVLVLQLPHDCKELQLLDREHDDELVFHVAV